MAIIQKILIPYQQAKRAKATTVSLPITSTTTATNELLLKKQVESMAERDETRAVEHAETYFSNNDNSPDELLQVH